MVLVTCHCIMVGYYFRHRVKTIGLVPAWKTTVTDYQTVIFFVPCRRLEAEVVRT